MNVMNVDCASSAAGFQRKSDCDLSDVVGRTTVDPSGRRHLQRLRLLCDRQPRQVFDQDSYQSEKDSAAKKRNGDRRQIHQTATETAPAAKTEAANKD
jgi:hypothetical protein